MAQLLSGLQAEMRYPATLAAIALLAALLVTVGFALAGEPAVTQGRVAQPLTSAKPMSDERFWDLAGRTTVLENDPERQIEALRSALRQLSVEDIEAFEAAFDRHMKRSYSWDLWGATYVVHGGASDDAFEYFRCWLISKGQRFFEQVLADPDSLADLLAPEVEGFLELERLAYVARKVWSEKTGRPLGEMPNA